MRDLFPRPRSVRWGDDLAPAGTSLVAVLDSRLSAEEYQLSVTAGGVELRHSDANGLRYGTQTLDQLRSSRGISTAEIHDRPDVATRGYMLDISRDRVPTRDTLELLVERLATCRYNHLQLYTEHTFAYADHETIWANATPMTASDMGWLDELCESFGIELAANQNTFGHMERWLQHPKYRFRAETPEGFERFGVLRPPSALAPTPDNAEFARDLVKELTSCVSSPHVNIGCDEIFELGRGRSANWVQDRGRTEVFVEHLRRIAEPLIAEGLVVQFWADMVERVPSSAVALAEAGAIATVWGYSRPDSESSAFAARLEGFAQSDFRTWVAPGTSGWNCFVGRHNNARANILDAVESAIEYRCEGVLVTEWGDNGHIQPPFATLPALAYGGATAWCRQTNGDVSDVDLARSISLHIVGDSSQHLARTWIELGSIVDTLGLSQVNGSQFFSSWIRTEIPETRNRPDPDRLTSALSQVEGGTADLDRASPEARDAAQLVAETVFSAALVTHGLQRLSGGRDPAAGSLAELRTQAEELRDQHRAHWLARSRAGGLQDSLSRMILP